MVSSFFTFMVIPTINLMSKLYHEYERKELPFTLEDKKKKKKSFV